MPEKTPWNKRNPRTADRLPDPPRPLPHTQAPELMREQNAPASHRAGEPGQKSNLRGRCAGETQSSLHLLRGQMPPRRPCQDGRRGQGQGADGQLSVWEVKTPRDLRTGDHKVSKAIQLPVQIRTWWKTP